MYDQEFRLYNLQPIHLQLPNQENQWLIVIHKPYIAVNIDSGTYLTLNENGTKLWNAKEGIMYILKQ